MRRIESTQLHCTCNGLVSSIVPIIYENRRVRDIVLLMRQTIAGMERIRPVHRCKTNLVGGSKWSNLYECEGSCLFRVLMKSFSPMVLCQSSVILLPFQMVPKTVGCTFPAEFRVSCLNELSISYLYGYLKATKNLFFKPAVV